MKSIFAIHPTSYYGKYGKYAREIHAPYLNKPIMPRFQQFRAHFITVQPRKVTICSRHVMASVQDVNIAEALLILCLIYVKKEWGAQRCTMTQAL